MISSGVGESTSAAGSRQKAVARAASVAAGEEEGEEEEGAGAAAAEVEVEVVDLDGIAALFQRLDGDVFSLSDALRRPICAREQSAVRLTSTRGARAARIVDERMGEVQAR